METWEELRIGRGAIDFPSHAPLCLTVGLRVSDMVGLYILHTLPDPSRRNLRLGGVIFPRGILASALDDLRLPCQSDSRRF